MYTICWTQKKKATWKDGWRYDVAVNQVLFLQIEIANEYMKRYNISIDEFNELDDKYAILEFIEDGYEPLHLTGNEGILEEINEYIKEQRAVKDG